MPCPAGGFPAARHAVLANTVALHDAGAGRRADMCGQRLCDGGLAGTAQAADGNEPGRAVAQQIRRQLEIGSGLCGEAVGPLAASSTCVAMTCAMRTAARTAMKKGSSTNPSSSSASSR